MSETTARCPPPEAILCVGGPLHGLRRNAVGFEMHHSTMGGPGSQGLMSCWGLVRHTYIHRITASGRHFWEWKIIPRWDRAGFMKPMYRQISHQS